MTTRILLVEDEFLVRLTLAEALTDAGYTVLEAETAEAALAALGEDRVALLLTDLQLPGALDGYALAAALRHRLPGLPVIFLTGRPGDLPDAPGARQRMIAKPYLPSEICEAVRRMLA